MQAFYNRSKMPGIVGAIDCTHIAIQSPGSHDAEIYRNRKGFFSINVHLVCDPTGYISDVVHKFAKAPKHCKLLLRVVASKL